MAHSIINLTCPGCGNPVSTSQEECQYCGHEIIVSTFNSVYNMPVPEVNKCANAYRKALAENPDNIDLNNWYCQVFFAN